MLYIKSNAFSQLIYLNLIILAEPEEEYKFSKSLFRSFSSRTPTSSILGPTMLPNQLLEDLDLRSSLTENSQI
jgi:hypothetical protein